MNTTEIFALLGFLAACTVAASMGAIFRPGAWYESLKKPAWRPPNWLFAPVWTLLYIMIAIAGWLIWRKLGWEAGMLPLGLWGGSLVFNALWSPTFFGAHRMGWAFFDIMLLWLSVLAMFLVFAHISPDAAHLLLPYLVWVSFAAVLNWSIWRLNRAG